MTQLAIAGGANGIFYLSTTALASPVNGAYRPVSGTVRCAGHAPLEVRLGALAHGYYAVPKTADTPAKGPRP